MGQHTPPMQHGHFFSDIPDELDVTTTRTLGLRLVGVLAEQLGADLEIQREGGTTFRLTFEEYLEAGTEMY